VKCPHPFHFAFFHRGVPYRFSMDRQAGRPVRTKHEAEELADRWRTDIRHGTFRSYSCLDAPAAIMLASAPLTFRDAADRWLADSGKGGGARLVALKDHTYRLNLLCAFLLPGSQPPRTFGTLPFTEVAADDIEAYRQARKAAGRSIVTTNHDLKLLRLIFNWGIRRRLLTETPFRLGHLAEIRLEREEGRNRRLEDDAAERRLLAAAGPHLRDVIVAMLDTACRPGEILSLQWQDVSLTRRELVVRADKTKTRRSRLVPLSARLRGVLEMRRLDPAGDERPPDHYVFGDALGRPIKSVHTAWRNVCATAGLSHFQLRDLRHEAASRFEQAGVPVTTVSRLLGHTNLTTTSTYLNTLRLDLHRAVQTLEAAGFAKRLQTDGDAPPDGESQPPQKDSDKPLMS
jgi:integrase